MSEKKLEDLVEFFILGDEPCVGFYESKVKKLGISIYDFQKQLTSALKLQELVIERIKKEDGLWEAYKNTDNLNYRFILQSLLDESKIINKS